jgi:two-component system cell cycle sensor histidine kinase/response regulator CckA
MIAYPELIRAELKPDHPAIHLINDIEKAAVQIADVNQQLLTLGRRGNFNLEPLNINDVVLTALGQIYPTPENLMIETKLSSNLKNIQGNGSQIHRLLTNLIVNARDAIDDSGKITVETRNVIINNHISPNSHYPAGDYVQLSVSDTGSGIPVEVQPKIFDPFFTTKSADQKSGSGLGLSVVRAVVDDHGGYIDFDTGPDKGTKFNIYFPITQECVIKHGQERVIGGNEHLLVIDNDIVQSSVTQNLLEKLGYRVTMAESGEKALELMKINSYDLLVIDTTQRHGIDAAETFKRARKINQLQKAILTSGYAENKLVEKALNLGAASLIKKPLTLKIIAFGVRKALDEPNRVKDQPIQVA